MRIALIDVNCKYSSTGKIVYDLYSQIRKGGNDAMVCYGRGEKIDEPNIYKIGVDLETYMHVALSRVTGFFGIFSPISTKRALQKLKEFKPDIVHLHELHGYYINYAEIVEYLKRNNIKTVWTFHCEFMYTGKCGQAFDCDKFKKECQNCPYLKEYPKSLFFDWTKTMFNQKIKLFKDFDNLVITTPSKWLYNRVGSSFLSSKKRVIVRNGIDNSNTFVPRNFDKLKERYNIKNKKVVLAVAPNLMSKQKGGEYILEVAKELKEKDIIFIMVGIDDLNYNFDSNIVALGRTKDQKELSMLYTMADLFIICSRYENFPTTAIEALSCGTNVVGFDSGGAKETAPENYGKFVEFGDVKALSKTIDDIFNSKIELKSPKECIEYAKENYSKEVMINNYMGLYTN